MPQNWLRLFPSKHFSESNITYIFVTPYSTVAVVPSCVAQKAR